MLATDLPSCCPGTPRARCGPRSSLLMESLGLAGRHGPQVRLALVSLASTRQLATNATSHGRRSFLVVMAASWRSRQRPSPLRGGHGGGLCPFVVVTAEVFYTSTQKQRKKSLHMRLPPFSSQEPAWGLRLFAALAPPGDFFGEIIEKKKKKAEKSHLHWPWAVVMWRSSPRRLGGHGGLLRTRPVVYLGGLSWFFNLAVKTP